VAPELLLDEELVLEDEGPASVVPELVLEEELLLEEDVPPSGAPELLLDEDTPASDADEVLLDIEPVLAVVELAEVVAPPVPAPPAELLLEHAANSAIGSAATNPTWISREAIEDFICAFRCSFCEPQRIGCDPLAEAAPWRLRHLDPIQSVRCVRRG
jgi:hypothetical protein